MIEISMNAIGEAFTRLQHRLFELEKLLPILSERLWVTPSHSTTVTMTWSYVNQTKLENIQQMLKAYETLPNSYPVNFEKIRNDLQYLNYFLCMKDFKPKDREDINQQLNEEVEKLNKDFDKMNRILTSDQMKLLETQREEIEVNIGLLEFYLNRYYSEEEMKISLANEQINLIGDLVIGAMESFEDAIGPVESIRSITFEIKNHLEISAEFLKEAIKFMVPRPT